MKVGDLIRPIVPDVSECEEIIPYLMEVVEIASTGINVIILSGPYIGSEIFFPKNNTRKWEIISE
tara:strand:- start:295 stop:489 length:195 start_codon:yes stop_codon:yes gene_type:complete